MNEMARRRPRNYRRRLKLTSWLAALVLLAVMPIGAASAMPAATVVPTVVTIEWHDGNADQINVLPILDDPGPANACDLPGKHRADPGQ